MSDPILSIEEAAQIMPLSKTSLYRAAKEGDGPFRKLRGRWMAHESEISAWVREGERGQPRGSSVDPMPRSRPRRGGNLMAEVHDLRRTA